MTTTRTPAGLGKPGRDLFAAVLADFELREHERLILLQAAQTADLLATLQASIKKHGPTITTPTGQVRSNPAVSEIRQHRLVFGRLLRQLDIPADAA